MNIIFPFKSSYIKILMLFVFFGSSFYFNAVNHELRNVDHQRFIVAGSAVGNGVGLFHYSGGSSTEKFRVTSYGGIFGNQTPAAVATPEPKEEEDTLSYFAQLAKDD